MGLHSLLLAGGGALGPLGFPLGFLGQPPPRDQHRRHRSPHPRQFLLNLRRPFRFRRRLHHQRPQRRRPRTASRPRSFRPLQGGGFPRGSLDLQPRRAQQPFSRGIFRVVHQRAVPGQLPGAERNQAKQPRRHGKRIEKPEGEQQGHHQQHAPIQLRLLHPLLDPDPRDQHHPPHEADQHPLDAGGVLAPIHHLQQKEHQAADQRHDQHRADRDRHVVGQRQFPASTTHVAPSR